MSRDGYLPPGVEHSDPHFHEDDPAPCVCGHGLDEHDKAQGLCEAEDCLCLMYEPDWADDEWAHAA